MKSLSVVGHSALSLREIIFKKIKMILLHKTCIFILYCIFILIFSKDLSNDSYSLFVLNRFNVQYLILLSIHGYSNIPFGLNIKDFCFWMNFVMTLQISIFRETRNNFIQMIFFSSFTIR